MKFIDPNYLKIVSFLIHLTCKYQILHFTIYFKYANEAAILGFRVLPFF